MATYAIGDIHGSYKTLRALLDRAGFSPRHDRIWLVGDLVNRGPRSLEVLRWAADQGEHLTAVLGNHDLHLLARADGVVDAKKRDTLDPVLAASDGGELVDWLRRRPLFYREGDFALVHAGLLPSWTWGKAETWAKRVSDALSREGGGRLVRRMRQRPLPELSARLPRKEELRLALYGFTMLRLLTLEGEPVPGFAGPPEERPANTAPWFTLPTERSERVTVICGHWAALGLQVLPGLRALDSGCVWGGPLTALRLEDGRLFQQANRDGALSP